ncbi:MAG: shikimate dehydrogenase [Lachnospiraceae bacterium]|nr:shikimate dehydrogenase [Lachnospiraceae bacterium]
MIEINGKTRTCGLIGNPVEHTMSPLIHNYLAETNNINMTYVPFHVKEDKIGDAVKGAFGLNILGVNVTVPYKTDVIEHLSDIDSLAQKMGAVNTLVRTDNGFKGYNTDVSGLLRAMRSDGVEIAGEDVIILGAGGVGRAVVFMCASNNAAKVHIINRSEEKAKAVADEVNKALNTDIVDTLSVNDYMKLVEGNDKKYLVIQCTSVGLSPNDAETFIDNKDFYKCVKTGYDLIYNPWETKFMKLVKEQGAEAYNGLKMLLYQAIDAFELWNNCKIDDETANKTYEKLKQAVISR